jgi:hypothetical protein
MEIRRRSFRERNELIQKRRVDVKNMTGVHGDWFIHGAFSRFGVVGRSHAVFVV